MDRVRFPFAGPNPIARTNRNARQDGGNDMAQQTATERSDLSAPPGPRGLPVVGSLLSLRNDPQIALTRIAREYGDVCVVKFGSVPTVIISHPDLMREAFSRIEFSDRWLGKITEIMTSGEDLAFAPYGEHWRQLQRFANRELLSHRRLQDTRERYIEDSVNAIAARVGDMSDAGEPLRPRDMLPPANAAMMFHAIFGKGDNDAAEFARKMDDLLDNVLWFFSNANAVNPADYIPMLKFLPNPAVEQAEAVSNRMTEILDFLIDIVANRPDLDLDNPNCLAEVMLKAMLEDEISRESMRSLIGDLLFAGIDTTAQSMAWLLLALANRPRIQDRIHDELNAAVGAGGMPGVEHQPDLPYLHAAIMEAMRYRTVGPLALPHKTNVDCELGGYAIPKGAQVLGNIYSVHHDPRFWESPDEFIPERFMPLQDGTPAPALTDGAFMPFSTGRRGCPGQGFAQIVIWLQACRLLHKYRFTPHGTDRLPEDEVFGLAISPIPYALDIERR